jgi:hypothetical protein
MAFVLMSNNTFLSQSRCYTHRLHDVIICHNVPDLTSSTVKIRSSTDIYKVMYVFIFHITKQIISLGEKKNSVALVYLQTTGNTGEI